MKIDKKLIVELEDWEVKEYRRTIGSYSEEQKADILEYLNRTSNK